MNTDRIIDKPTELEINYYDQFVLLSQTILKLREGRISARHIDTIITQLNELAFYVNELQLKVMYKSSELNYYKQAVDDLTTEVVSSRFVDIK
jgi:hypothetical protein|tara:strand:+ start:185 stop:463 length:279 start_codon:yes stop_codon:yes gene_type:complete